MSLSRRSFLKAVGLGGVAVAVAPLARVAETVAAVAPAELPVPVVALPAVVPPTGLALEAAWVPMTNEVLADSAWWSGEIEQALRMALAREEDRVLFGGIL